MRMLIICTLTLVSLANALADTEAAEATALIDALDIKIAARPIRESPNWRPPTHIIVRVDSDERLAWFQQAAPGVELIRAGDKAAINRNLDTIDALVGVCDAPLLQKIRDLHWVQIYSAGVNPCIEKPEIHDGMLITNMQRVSGPEIAEHVMAMLLAFTRGLNQHIRTQSDGRWNPGLVPMQQRWELTGKTILIVGLGGIGTQVARRARAFDMTVLAIRNSSRDGPDTVAYVGGPDELLELARRADVVVNSTPLTDKTTGIFNKEFFTAMKSTAYFINVGRGRSADTNAMLDALKNGGIAGAGLDVTDPEPLPADHPLWQMENVIITPHISAGSDLIRDRLYTLVRENLRRYTAGEAMLSVVDIERGY